MTTMIAGLRRKVLTPDVSATRLAVRGFRPKNAEARTVLETVGRSFLDGYAQAAEVADPEDVHGPLAEVPPRYRGFAYEGAAMGFAVRDSLSPVGGRRVDRFLAGRGGAHVYMAYIGIGWATARVPGVLRPAKGATDPLLRWLVLDGYGFHQAYFRTAQYVHRQFRDPQVRWPDAFRSQYAPRAVDQWIGRALWFVNGTDVERTVSAVRAFAPDRRADLFGGVGLAATYAGGAGSEELVLLRELAGEHRDAVALGSAFAAEARVRAELVIPETGVATAALTGMSPQQAADLVRATRPDPSRDDGGLPAYEAWRLHAMECLAAVSGPRS